MYEKEREIHDLKKLLTTIRLTALDRKAIEARIEELSPTRQNEERPRPPSPYALGVFDRPKPSPERSSTSSRQPQSRAAIPLREEHIAPSQPPSEGPEVIAPAPSLSPAEIERLSQQLVEIAERIVLLRRVWVTTLAFEVDQEAEAWLARLQQIASTMPREAAERALGKHRGFLDQPVRTVKRPQIPEHIQERLLPPSAPSGRSAEWKSELYWEVRSMKREPEPVRPVGYLPDGLQSWVS